MARVKELYEPAVPSAVGYVFNLKITNDIATHESAIRKSADIGNVSHLRP